jgi:pimeloyl-ACP methyl ester carboxylesterase
MFLKSFKRAASVLLSLVLVSTVVGCSNPGTSADAAASVSPALAKFYSQKLTWKSCGDIWCATVTVPLDWNKPSGKTMKIAINEHTSPTASGYLLVNPGGPGASGVEFVRDSYDYIGTAALKAKYNMVGFDPRGTGQSSPIKCLDAAGTDQLLYEDTGLAVGSAQELASERAQIASFVAACKLNSGDVLGYVDTVSAARDLDVIRAALKQTKLDYLGFSYGTFLGATYAALYPKNVGRFVLDGAIDPNVSDAQQSLNQLAGFDLALTDFVKWCLKKGTCPFDGTVDHARAQIAAVLRSFEGTSMPTDTSRNLTLPGLTTGLIMGLYSNDYWQYVLQAFNEVKQGTGSTFLKLADFYNDRSTDGTYSTNTLEANIAISCLDSRQPADAASMNKQNKLLIAKSSVFGRYWQNGGVTCEHWPYPVAKRPTSFAAKGAPTIVVVGTTGDPATPYQQAVDLAHKVLAKGFLVTFKGEGHTAYGRSNSCVNKAVDNWLVSGILPKTEPKC